MEYPNYLTEVGRQLSNLDVNDMVNHYKDGKTAISTLFKSFNLKPDDEVYISTTFGTKYVSSCVTSTIFNFCKPSKIITSKTKVIFIIHEFGFPNEQIFEFKKIAENLNIPIVEDCAHTAYSFYRNGQKVGEVGDFGIYSLKKILPYNNAGLLLKRSDKFPYLDKVQKSATKRQENYRKLYDYFTNEKFYAESLIDNISPYVFLFRLSENDRAMIHRLKRFDLIYWVNVDFYSLPVHQKLDSNYFHSIMNQLKQNK
jgi:hypothetical protein